ncbi:hypothetical protein HG717_33620 [Rhodococcus erythropolis]|uniref:hypothetical protein n=1 Tax=Rhodococcus erythropolis TaxID=1833 RepID=UPI001C9B6B46|nr:hypothetical protein [Rhodococcus erythropolis]MBY6388812.1 hypothetical protein [Rhodococcus erythropolis]
MCKAGNEPGGPRRCSSDPRAQLQRSVDRVNELERRRDQLAEQIHTLNAERAQLADAIDDEHEHLYETITATTPRIIASNKNERVKVGYSVRGGRPAVSVDWYGAIGAASWDGRAEFDERTAHALADALSGPSPEQWQVKRVTVPDSRYEFVYSRQEPAKPGPIVLYVIDRDDRQDLKSNTLKLNATAVRGLSRALRDAANSLARARPAPPAGQPDGEQAKGCLGAPGPRRDAGQFRE